MESTAADFHESTAADFAVYTATDFGILVYKAADFDAWIAAIFEVYTAKNDMKRQFPVYRAADFDVWTAADVDVYTAADCDVYTAANSDPYVQLYIVTGTILLKFPVQLAGIHVHLRYWPSKGHLGWRDCGSTHLLITRMFTCCHVHAKDAS